MQLFTVEEANALIPTVRGIAQRIQRSYKSVVARREAAQRAAANAEHGGGGMANGAPEYVRAVQALSHAVSELDALGVQLKDYEQGLLDFPSMRDGRVVLLCWKLGEGDQLEWWHELEAGFAGRRSL